MPSLDVLDEPSFPVEVKDTLFVLLERNRTANSELEKVGSGWSSDVCRQCSRV